MKIVEIVNFDTKFCTYPEFSGFLAITSMWTINLSQPIYVVVKTNSALDFIKNNILRGGIIFEKIQGRVSFN